MKGFLFCGLAFVFAACGSNDQKPAEAALPQVPLAKSANSPVFNASFEEVLTQYFTLGNGLVAEDDSLIAQSGRALLKATDSLKLDSLKADTLIITTAQTYASGISSEVMGLLGEQHLAGKRKSFQIISNQLYDLVRTVQYDRQVIYHYYCASSFNDQGAGWLTNIRQVRNPYIPKKMISCGELKDSLDFRIKP